jgi:hypothetical protein
MALAMHSVRLLNTALLVRIFREITSEQSQYHSPAGLWMNCQRSMTTPDRNNLLRKTMHWTCLRSTEAERLRSTHPLLTSKMT